MIHKFLDFFRLAINWFMFHTRIINRNNISILSKFQIMRTLYVLQPYEVGSKKSKSLALIIPAKLVKKYKIDTSTVFALQHNPNTKTITLHQTSTILTEIQDQNQMTIPEDQSFETSKATLVEPQ